MKILLNFPSAKKSHLLEMLRQISYVTIEPMDVGNRSKTVVGSIRKPALSKSQKKKNTDELIDGLRDAFEDVKLHQAGKKQLRDARDIVAEL
ncbi:hypothetical protein FACS189443_4840 [Planctomycetales bacterium]|nr:hypothetical protein FACS189443_4840 [Planctomycetales bacterium]